MNRAPPPAPSAAAARAPLAATALVAALAGTLAGLLGARFAGVGTGGSDTAAERRHAAATSDPAADRLEALLAELTVALHELRGELARSQERTAPAAARPLAAEAPAADLHAATGRLVAALERAAASLGAAPRSTTLPVAIPREGTPQQRAALEELLALTQEERLAAWRFAGYAEVLEAFGPPDEVLLQNGLLVLHYFGTHEGLGFRFFQGAVISLW